MVLCNIFKLCTAKLLNNVQMFRKKEINSFKQCKQNYSVEYLSQKTIFNSPNFKTRLYVSVIASALGSPVVSVVHSIGAWKIQQGIQT